MKNTSGIWVLNLSINGSEFEHIKSYKRKPTKREIINETSLKKRQAKELIKKGDLKIKIHWYELHKQD